MKTVTLPVLHAFDYQGRSFAPGDTVDMVPIDAAVYARKGLVSLTGRTVQNREMVAPKAGRRRARKSAYRTTHMVEQD